MIPEPAEPDSLFCIGPDHEMPSAADPSDMNVALGHPFLESVVAHSNLVRQVAAPPLIDGQQFSRPAPRTEAQPVNQLPGQLRGEPVDAARWRAKALPVEAFGDLLGRLTGRSPCHDQASHPRKIVQSLVTADRSPQRMLDRRPSNPINTEHGLFGISMHRHRHPLDKGADNLLAFHHCGIGGAPQGRDVGGQRPDSFEVLR